MTVRTMPAKPSRAAGPAGPETELWRGMLWVTWRQHRGVLISVPVAFVAAVTVMLVTGLKIHHDYAILTACHPAAAPACQGLLGYLNSTGWHEGNGVQVALLAAPVLLAMFAGPPVVARELENGTFRYAWTQGIGRVRWTMAKLTFLGAMITILAFASSQLFTWYFAPFLRTRNITVLSAPAFATSGVAYTGGGYLKPASVRFLAWSLYGFSISYEYSRDPRFLETAEACADYFITHSNSDGVPPWDFNAPPESRRLLDTSAAAIAASGLLRLCRLLQDPVKGHHYWSTAIRILRTLCEQHLAKKDKKWEGILKGGVYHLPKELGVDESVMWGEYFFVESLEQVLQQLG